MLEILPAGLLEGFRDLGAQRVSMTRVVENQVFLKIYLELLMIILFKRLISF